MIYDELKKNLEEQAKKLENKTVFPLEIDGKYYEFLSEEEINDDTIEAINIVVNNFVSALVNNTTVLLDQKLIPKKANKLIELVLDMTFHNKQITRVSDFKMMDKE